MSNPVIAPKIVVVRGSGLQGPQGPPGSPSSGSGYASRTVFAYNNITILPLYLAAGSDRIARVELLITTAFTDSAATLSVGDSGDTQRLLTTAQVKPSLFAAFEANPLHLYSSATQTNLYISPGASSGGNGVVYIYLA